MDPGIEAENFPFVFEHLYGKCHIFALALHKVLGFRVDCFWDDEAYFEYGPDGEEDYTGQALVHAYGVDVHGNTFDARGRIALDKVLADYEVNSEWTQNDVSEGALLATGLTYSAVEFDTCAAYIEKNRHLFVLDALVVD